MPANDSNEAYDVFISYSSKDRAWVRNELLPRLETSGLRVCIDFRDFEPGAPSVKEMKRGVETSRKTLLVLTPDYLESAWAEFEALMLQTLDPANRQRRLIPLLKEKCSLPLEINYLTYVDFAKPEDWGIVWTQLLTALGAPAQGAPTTRVPRGSVIPRVTHFVGREEELAIVKAALLRRNSVGIFGAAGIVGLGGIGKTALARMLLEDKEIKARFDQPPIWFEVGKKELTQVLDTLAIHLGKQEIAQYRNLALKKKALQKYFGENPCLVVFDNLWDADIARTLLHISSGCAVVITSRKRMVTDALNKPVYLAGLAEKDAVKLFCRISKAKPSLEVKEICRLLGHHPLAIRIAAARTCEEEETPEWMLARLQEGNRLEVLATEEEGSDANVIVSMDLSFNDLSPDEKQFFAALGVFTEAGFTVQAAREITHNAEAGRLLEKLLRWSMVERSKHRYRLHDLLRDYARLRIEGDGPYVRMSAYYLELVQEAEKKQDYEWIELELLNAFAGMAGAEERGDWETVDRYVRPSGLGNFLRSRGYWSEYIHWLDRVQKACEMRKDLVGIAEHLAHKAEIFFQEGRHSEARESAEKCLAIASQHGEKRQEALALYLLGYLNYREGELDLAEEQYEASKDTYQRINDEVGIAFCLCRLGVLTQSKGDYQAAQVLFQKSLEIFEREEHRPGIIKVTHHMSRLARAKGDYDEARTLSEEALRIARQLGHKEGIAYSLHQQAVLAKNQNEYDLAEALYEESIQLFKELGFLVDYCSALRNLGWLVFHQGRPDRGRRLLEESLTIAQEIGYRRGVQNGLQLLGELHFSEGHIEQAKERMREALKVALELGDMRSLARSLEHLSLVAERESDLETAYRMLWQGKTIYERLDAKRRIESIIKKYDRVHSRLSSSLIPNLEVQARAELKKWVPEVEW
jgi:tetratricopeptide (TPR) repeat protein